MSELGIGQDRQARQAVPGHHEFGIGLGKGRRLLKSQDLGMAGQGLFEQGRARSGEADKESVADSRRLGVITSDIRAPGDRVGGGEPVREPTVLGGLQFSVCRPLGVKAAL